MYSSPVIILHGPTFTANGCPGMAQIMARAPGDDGSLTYRDAGVNIDAGHDAVARIRASLASTRRPEQLGDVGGFAGLFRVPEGFEHPTLVACTDGCGTKVLVAIAMDRHDTIGIDAVAMNVNDLLCTGAEPLFVLDYIACDAVVPERIEQIVAGIAEGCRQSGAALLGGETAEHPGTHAPGHYDLAAFAVGIVERDQALGTHRVCPGDVVLGLPSSGLHSNGYSLARKALLDSKHLGLRLSDPLPGGDGTTVGDALLVPTRIYEREFRALRALSGGPLRAAAHITGGGLIENPPRILPPALAMELDLQHVPRPPILTTIASAGVHEDELRRTFNCGLGMLLVISADDAPEVRTTLSGLGSPVLDVGRIVARKHPDNGVVFLS